MKNEKKKNTPRRFSDDPLMNKEDCTHWRSVQSHPNIYLAFTWIHFLPVLYPFPSCLLPACLPACLPASQLVNLPACLPACQSACLHAFLPICLPLPICPEPLACVVLRLAPLGPSSVAPLIMPHVNRQGPMTRTTAADLISLAPTEEENSIRCRRLH